MELCNYVDIIENKLQNSFDITKDCLISDFTYDLFAEYHLRNEKYMLIKKAVIYAFENNEYILMKTYEELNKEDYHNYTESLIKSINTIIKPSKEHMSSTISGIILVKDVLGQDLEYIKKCVKKFKYNKSFAFGFKGWVDLRLILISIEDGLISSNKKGKEVASFYNICSQ